MFVPCHHSAPRAIIQHPVQESEGIVSNTKGPGCSVWPLSATRIPTYSDSRGSDAPFAAFVRFSEIRLCKDYTKKCAVGCFSSLSPYKTTGSHRIIAVPPGCCTCGYPSIYRLQVLMIHLRMIMPVVTYAMVCRLVMHDSRDLARSERIAEQ